MPFLGAQKIDVLSGRVVDVIEKRPGYVGYVVEVGVGANSLERVAL